MEEYAEKSVNISVQFWINKKDVIVTKGSKGKLMWPRRDSNTQPSDLESDALPLRHGVPDRKCLVILGYLIFFFKHGLSFPKAKVGKKK